MKRYEKPTMKAVVLRSCRTICESPYTYPNGVEVMGQGEDNAPAAVRECKGDIWDTEW